MKREFPDHPVLCVGGVVIEGDSVLLIRRGKEPHKDEWSLPGGMVEIGETIKTAVRREVKEETGIRVKAVELLAVFERVVRQSGSIRFHYVVLDYLCRFEGGKMGADSDVTAARWVRRANLAQYDLRSKALEVIRMGFAAAGRSKIQRDG